METESAENTSCLKPGDQEAIAHLRQALLDGRNWYLALLESISKWTSPEETSGDRHYRYLISGEAFDLLVLSERLLDTVKGLVPEEELIEYLFHNRPPLKISDDEFKKLIGPAKYSAQLNYMYGVILEESLIGAVEDEIHKEHFSRGRWEESDVEEEAFRRVYGGEMRELLGSFREEKHYRVNKQLDLTELKEFYYWLFKYRVRRCEKARVASDTKKALSYLVAQWASKGAGRLDIQDMAG